MSRDIAPTSALPLFAGTELIRRAGALTTFPIDDLVGELPAYNLVDASVIINWQNEPEGDLVGGRPAGTGGGRWGTQSTAGGRLTPFRVLGVGASDFGAYGTWDPPARFDYSYCDPQFALPGSGGFGKVRFTTRLRLRGNNQAGTSSGCVLANRPGALTHPYTSFHGITVAISGFLNEAGMTMRVALADPPFPGGLWVAQLTKLGGTGATIVYPEGTLAELDATFQRLPTPQTTLVARTYTAAGVLLNEMSTTYALCPPLDLIAPFYDTNSTIYGGYGVAFTSLNVRGFRDGVGE